MGPEHGPLILGFLCLFPMVRALDAPIQRLGAVCTVAAGARRDGFRVLDSRVLYRGCIGQFAPVQSSVFKTGLLLRDLIQNTIIGVYTYI